MNCCSTICLKFICRFAEILTLENSIKVEVNKQEGHKKHMMKRGELMMSLRLVVIRKQLWRQIIITWKIVFPRIAFQHLIDVLRHVGSSDVYKNLEYPTVDLKLALIENVNPNLPEVSLVMETDSKSIKYFLISFAKISLNRFKASRLGQSSSSAVDATIPEEESRRN